MEAVEEALEIGRRSGCKVWISHHKACGRANWGKVEKTLELMPQISQVLKSWETRIADSLTEEERQSLSDLLAKMKDRATEYMEDR